MSDGFADTRKDMETATQTTAVGAPSTADILADADRLLASIAAENKAAGERSQAERTAFDKAFPKVDATAPPPEPTPAAADGNPADEGDNALDGFVDISPDSPIAGEEVTASADETDLLDGLVERTAADSGAPFKPDILSRLADLREENLAAFESLRTKLKKAGCRVTVLDQAILGENGTAGTFEEATVGPAQRKPRDNRQADGPRLQLELDASRINENTRTCANLLRDEIFLRGPTAVVLVRAGDDAVPGREAEDEETEPGVTIDGVRHAKGSLILTEPTVDRILYRIDEYVLFEKYDSRTGSLRPASCPAAIGRRVIAAASDLGVFRQCRGIAATPIFYEGEIDTTNGYNARHQVVVNITENMPAIPTAPAKADARAALKVLLRPFRGYLKGLEREGKRKLRSAISAAAVTAVLRASLLAAPMVEIDANVPGAGKGKMARALAVLATGRLPSIIREGHSDEEMEKRLAAAILSGAPAILLDNLQRTLASSTIESGLTEGVATIREFGTLKSPTVACSALVIVTANNAAMRADLLRRTLPVRIIVDTDQPELREFGFDPYEEVRADRPALLAAAFTIVKAWWLARNTAEGRRIRRTKLGSFEVWSDLVAGAVEWLTGINPIALIEARKAADPMRGNERRVMAALFGKFGEAQWLAKDAAIGLGHDVWAAVMTFKGDHPAAHQVGVWLRKRKDKVLGDLQLRGELDRDGVMHWSIKRGGCGGSRGIVTPASQETEKDRNDGIGITSSFCDSMNARESNPREPPHPPQTVEGTAAPGDADDQGIDL